MTGLIHTQKSDLMLEYRLPESVFAALLMAVETWEGAIV